MKKKLSKLIAVLFILATTLGGAGSGVAANKAIRPNEGNLTIHKYWSETSAGVGDEGTGEKLDDEPSNPAIKGIQFDVYLLKPQASSLDTPPSDKDGWVYSKTDDVLTISKAGETSMTYNLVKQTADADKYADGKTDSNGELKYTGLDAGYYYVEENLTASPKYEVQGTGNEDKKITSATKPFIVAVPMTNLEGDGWNKDVHVYPKNQGLNPEKKPEVPSINVGDKVEWTITANVPSDIADYQKFDVIDELDKRLNYAGDDTVLVVGSDGSEPVVPLVTLTKSTDDGINGDYVIKHQDGSTKEKLTISLTPAGISKLATTTGVKKVVLSFETTVNGNIKSDDENGIKNDATIEFDNGTTTDTDKTPIAEVHTGEIKIDKTYSGGIDSINDTSAQFQLAKTSANAEAGEYYRVILDSTDSYITDIVAPGEPGYTTAKEWIALPSQADTKEQTGLVGNIFYVTSFEGLQTYTETTPGGIKDYKSYYLVETKAPEDYNLLDGPVEVAFTKDDLETKYVHTKAIENKNGFTLPNTGGVGTILLVVFGIILIGLAIILSMNKKKKTA